MYVRLSGVLLAIALVLSGSAEAQERFGGLNGRVIDQQNLALPAVTVVTTNQESGELRTVVTDADGQFNIPNLVPGRYRVRFELSGFSVVERRSVGPPGSNLPRGRADGRRRADRDGTGPG